MRLRRRMKRDVRLPAGAMILAIALLLRLDGSAAAESQNGEPGPPGPSLAPTPLIRWRAGDLLNAFSRILRTARPTTPTAGLQEVQPFVEHQFGVYPIGPFKSSTKVAIVGLDSVIRGNLDRARKCLEWLVREARPAGEQGAALLVVNDYDFAPKYPYSLRRGWPSALTQGLALELAAQLYSITTETTYSAIARRLYNGYGIPVNQGGFTRWVDGLPVFEEYPASDTLTAVFNGFAVAALALEGYAQVFHSSDAHDLFTQSVAWLEKNIQSYEATEEGCALSRYSLAQRRNETLFRFNNIKGAPFVRRVCLCRGDTEVAHIDVGSPEDTNVMNAGYLWHNPASQCWGEREVQDGAQGRRMAGYPQAEYRHSPVSFAVTRADSPSAIVLNLIMNKGDSFALQFFSPRLNKYCPLTTVESSQAGQQEIVAALPAEFVDSLPSRLLIPEKVERKYLDDNQELLTAVAEVSSSQRLRYFARRWNRDWITTLNDVEGGIWINEDQRAAHFPWKPSRMVLEAKENPPGATAVDSPAVIRLRLGQFMYYLGEGEEPTGCYLAIRATSDTVWRKRGALRLPFVEPRGLAWCSAAYANGVDAAKGVLLALGYREPGDQKPRIVMAQSNDGLNFGAPWTLDAEIAAQPMIFFDSLSGLWNVCGANRLANAAVQLRSYVTEDFKVLTQTGLVDTVCGQFTGAGDACSLPAENGARLVLWDAPDAWRAYYYDPRKKMAVFAGKIYRSAAGVGQRISHIQLVGAGEFIGVVSPKAGAAGKPVVWSLTLDNPLLRQRLLSMDDALRVGSTREYARTGDNE